MKTVIPSLRALKAVQQLLETDGSYICFEGHLYRAVYTDTSWNNAKTQCEKWGGHLATITNARLQAYLQDRYDMGHTYWLGGRTDANGNPYWITGEDWEYSNWNPSQPDYRNGYLRIWKNNDGRWDDLDSDWDSGGSGCNYYICEWDSFEDVGAWYYPEFEGHYFKAYYSKENWNNAQSICESLGGHLATSTSQEKNAFLTNLISGADSSFWIGMHDRESEGNFKWITGEPATWTNFASGEPNNYGVQYYEDCVEIYPSSGEWNDQHWTSATYYICEWDDEGSLPPPLQGKLIKSSAFNIEAGSVPEGLRVSQNGIISGTPIKVGTKDMSVTVRTNYGTDTETIKIAITQEV